MDCIGRKKTPSYNRRNTVLSFAAIHLYLASVMFEAIFNSAADTLAFYHIPFLSDLLLRNRERPVRKLAIWLNRVT